MDKMNVAVIGVGYWGKKIASEYALMSKTNPSVQLLGVCDVFEDNLKFCKEKYDVPYLAKNPDEILLNPKIDAVHICTPSITHYDICREALKHNKHVTVEKPMTLNSLEAIKLVGLAHEKNLVLSVGHIFRFDAAIEKAKALIENRWFGDLYWMKLTWTALMPPMIGRDIITDLAPHPFDILNFLTNDWPEKVTCVAKAHRRGQREETAYITSEFKSNLLAHIEISWLHPEKVREVQIMGSDRFAKIDCVTQKFVGFEDGHFFDLPVERSNTINSELSHFVHCVRDGCASNDAFLNKNNGLVGANVVKLLELSRAAMENGRTELVE
ncbi:MAG: Gfo/Idh/MocA family oxidoreductase [Candidatus Bathyarchaeota archaeon]|nr:Gfo/Idh/MocA family oxidoreductase [Candidatus Bathyarchaeota archaeon]